MFTGCEKEEIRPFGTDNSSDVELRNGNGKGKGKKDKGDYGDDNGDSVHYASTYALFQAVDNDPLFRISISESGDLMLLETDPSVTSWGSDYWGFWSDPFDYVNMEVSYTIGLTHTTYHFEQLPGNKMDVTKTLVVQPYPSGEPTTMVTHPGVYRLVE